MSLDAVYTERAHLVAALSKLFPSSIEQHQPKVAEEWDREWMNVCVIDLPTGQASWHIAIKDMHLFEHLPRNQGRVWDGHLTAEKYARLDALPLRKPFGEIFVNVSLANEPEFRAEVEEMMRNLMKEVFEATKPKKSD